MSLRFVFGPSGAGKSTKLYQEIIERSMEQPDQNFLIIVPDQFTMQTQKELVTLHERGGILNIDVLSFGRLAHRILDEVGETDTPVLDDTGKSLVLQKVAMGMADRLPVLGGHLHRQGYIHEVKSALSEFMQYGITPADMPQFMKCASGRGALLYKLQDLTTLYQGFLDYIHDKFITTEETLSVLRRSLAHSGLIRGSVVVFDGFTGFTPIQNRVIQEIMTLAEETVISLTLGLKEDPYTPDPEQKLFYLTKKTVKDLEKLAKEAGVIRGKDTFTDPAGKGRFVHSPALRALEENLFRYPYKPYEEQQDQIHLMEVSTPSEEVHQVGRKMKELIREKGLAYRDMALIIGDLEGYAPYVETQFARMQIPCYIDRTRGIVLNPLIEFIKSVLELYLKDFSYEAVFHYLRSGLSDITMEEADMLENYVLRTGIRGYQRWSKRFTLAAQSIDAKKAEQAELEGAETEADMTTGTNAATDQATAEEELRLQQLNLIRERFLAQIEFPGGRKQNTVAHFVECLYDFLIRNRVQEKLVDFQHMFEEQGNLTKAREYAQIYRLVMDLLNQIYELLKEETLSLREFADILEAGFGEIQVGTIPQNVDRVLVGDIERTRLKQVKVLFLLGVNDGNIPKNGSKGGIISDMDREFLRESELELAPSPRQQMFIQRFYLYLNLTKPSEGLYLSYAKMNSTGKAIRPAYLIDVLQKLFVHLVPDHPEQRVAVQSVVSPQEGLDELAQGLRHYVQGMSEPEEEADFMALYQVYGEESQQEELRSQLTQAAFKRYQESGLSKAVARALYGVNLENSVSRLETYAACAYHHFLQYGLSLREREEFGFESVDMGNIFHEVLEKFSGRLAGSGYSWFDFPEAFAHSQVEEVLELCAARYGETVLYSSARNEYAITRMGRILTRTLLTLQKQLQHGAFTPDAYELSFHYAEDLESVQIALSEEEQMRLRGRIDRIDIAEEDNKVYVKIIDYKSGNRRFDLAALYYGLQLQLVVYMNAAMEWEAKKYPDKEVVPAAMLYYHMEDPTVESAVELSAEELNEQILEQLRMHGVVSTGEGIVEKLDRFMGSKSAVIPVERKKDGSFTAYSSVLSSEEMQVVSEYVSQKVKAIGTQIMEGNIQVDPYEKGSVGACTYCAYKGVCGFDSSIPGYERRVLKEISKDEALGQMEAHIWQSNSRNNSKK